MSDTIKAVLSNAQHPEYGQATVSFPIPRKEYDHTMELLEGLGIGDALEEDCRVAELDSRYPVLNRLEGAKVNVDELDYLAKRLGCFCKGERDQFMAMAHKLNVSDIQDFINLTFCCQEATVITDLAGRNIWNANTLLKTPPEKGYAGTVVSPHVLIRASYQSRQLKEPLGMIMGQTSIPGAAGESAGPHASAGGVLPAGCDNRYF